MQIKEYSFFLSIKRSFHYCVCKLGLIHMILVNVSPPFKV